MPLLLLPPLFTLLPCLLIVCSRTKASIRTQAKQKYQPGNIPVFEDPEQPESNTQYDMKTERFFPKQGTDNPFEVDCLEKSPTGDAAPPPAALPLPPSSGSGSGSGENTGTNAPAAAAKAAAAKKAEGGKEPAPGSSSCKEPAAAAKEPAAAAKESAAAAKESAATAKDASKEPAATCGKEAAAAAAAAPASEPESSYVNGGGKA